MDAFDWRASIAEISADGPFSAFVGVDRVLILLDGDGVRLRSSDGRVAHSLDEPLVPFMFSGDDAITASLIGGASSDFNVMTRRNAVRADVAVLRRDEMLGECSAGLVLALRGTWLANATFPRAQTGTVQPVHSLTANTGMWWDGEPLKWNLTTRDAEAALIAVRVWRTADQGES